MEVAFPEMEKRYIQATVKQMESYRKSRYPIPEHLLNRPHTVQGECLANQEKAKAITNSMVCSTQQEGVFLVSGNPKHSPKSGYQVNIRLVRSMFVRLFHSQENSMQAHVCSIYPLSNMGMVSFTCIPD